MNAIAIRPTDSDYMRLQSECKQISEPSIALILDIYNRSPFRMVYSPSQPEIPPQIFYAHEYEAEAVRQHMKAAIDMHVAEWCKRFGIEIRG